jgi:hypothetical protein
MGFALVALDGIEEGYSLALERGEMLATFDEVREGYSLALGSALSHGRCYWISTGVGWDMYSSHLTILKKATHWRWMGLEARL